MRWQDPPFGISDWHWCSERCFDLGGVDGRHRVLLRQIHGLVILSRRRVRGDRLAGSLGAALARQRAGPSLKIESDELHIPLFVVKSRIRASFFTRYRTAQSAQEYTAATDAVTYLALFLLHRAEGESFGQSRGKRPINLKFRTCSVAVSNEHPPFKRDSSRRRNASGRPIDVIS